MVVEGHQRNDDHMSVPDAEIPNCAVSCSVEKGP